MKPPSAKSASIVLLGDFNPMIFQPAWFAAHKLIRDKEAEMAVVGIIHRQITDFRLEWLAMRVEQNRLQAQAIKDGSNELIKDILIGTFSLLSHTPIRVMGINWTTTCTVDDIEHWHSAGHKLAPKDIWSSVLKNPGLRTITISGQREDEYDGYINVTVEPCEPNGRGISIRINDHYQVKENRPGIGADDIMAILSKSWLTSDAKSTKIIESVVKSI